MRKLKEGALKKYKAQKIFLRWKNSISNVEFKGIFNYKNKNTKIFDQGNLGNIPIFTEFRKLTLEKTTFKLKKINNLNKSILTKTKKISSIKIFYNLDSRLLELGQDYKNIDFLTQRGKLLLPIYTPNQLVKMYENIQTIEQKFDNTYLDNYTGYISSKKEQKDLVQLLDNELGKYLPKGFV